MLELKMALAGHQFLYVRFETKDYVMNKLLTLAVAAALGLAATPALAQEEAAAGAGGLNSVSTAVGALSTRTLSGLGAATDGLVTVIARSNADPKVTVGDDDDDDDTTTTTTTTTTTSVTNTATGV